MKRLLLIPLACALLLGGCGQKAPADAPVPQAETAAVIGRSYAPEQALPRDLHTPEEGELLAQTGAVWRAAQTEDGAAALYCLSGSTVLVQWDGAVAVFDGWSFDAAPQMRLLPGNEKALMVVLPSQQREELHLLTQDEHGTVSDYPLPDALYEKSLTAALEFSKRSGTLRCGAVTLAVPSARACTGTLCADMPIHYSADSDGRITAQLTLLSPTKDGGTLPVARLSAVPVLDLSSRTYRLTELLLGQPAPQPDAAEEEAAPAQSNP